MKVTVNNNDNNNTYYSDSSIATDRNIHNNRPDMVMLDETTKEAYIIDVAIPNSHSLHSNITEKLQKYTDLKEHLSDYGNEKSLYHSIWKFKTA